MKSSFIIMDTIEEMLNAGKSKKEIDVEVDRIRESWTWKYKIKKFIKDYFYGSRNKN